MIHHDPDRSWITDPNSDHLKGTHLPVALMYHDPDRSWITDLNSDHPKGTHPITRGSRNTDYMFSIFFRKHHDEKKENNLVTLIIKKICKFSLLDPSLHVRQQCTSSVSPSSHTKLTRFLTDQRACFPRTVF